MKRIKEYLVHYDIASKTQTVLEDGIEVQRHTFKECPYILFDELKEKIESGLIKFIMWKKARFVS